MKKYWVEYYNGFGNCYNLYWTDSKEEENEIKVYAERITRKEAEQLARAERWRRKNNPSFAYYGSEYILPINASHIWSMPEHGFIVERNECVFE